MRISILVVSLALLAAVVAGCGASAPEAAFTATPTTGQAPLAVTFTDASTNEPTSWRWDFGDGETSTEQSPTHEYALAGEYTVTLTATNDEGSGDLIKQALIAVTPPPNPVCADLQELRATLGRLQELELGPGVLGELKQIGSDAKAILDRLRTDAAGEYAEQLAQLDQAYESLTGAISALQSSPTSAIGDIVAAVTNGFAAIDAVESAISEGCG
ncbi:MAG: PKD domain-containing protein [Gaiellales bacterium]